MKGLKYWKGMTDDEREEVKLHLKKNNLDLDITDAAVTDLSVFTYKVKLEISQIFVIKFFLFFSRLILQKNKENFYQLHKY